MNVYINIDEVTEADSPLEYLQELKDRYSNFKATVFVGLFRCSIDYLDLLKSKSWLEVCVHGIYGRHRELEFYNKSQLVDLMNKLEATYTGYYTGGFKAPNFAYTQDVYEVCLDKGFWINMHPFHKKEFISGISYYQFDRDNDGFEFAGHAKNNQRDKKGIDQSFSLLTQTLDHMSSRTFKFCSENLKVNA